MRIEDLLETNQLIARQQNMKLYVACFALYGALLVYLSLPKGHPSGPLGYLKRDR